MNKWAWKERMGGKDKWKLIWACACKKEQWFNRWKGRDMEGRKDDGKGEIGEGQMEQFE